MCSQGRRLGAADERIIGGADRIEDADAVLPQPDPGTEVAHLGRPFVNTDRPSALRQCRGEGQSGKAAAGDLRMALFTHRFRSRSGIRRLSLLDRLDDHLLEMVDRPVPVG